METSADDWLQRLARVLEVEPYAGFGPPTVDVAPSQWAEAALRIRDELHCSFFDYLTAVDGRTAEDEPRGLWVVAHLAGPRVGAVDSVLLRTWLPPDDRAVACLCDVYAGAAWHERETQEMFGVGFLGHPDLAPLLLSEDFAGHPLSKDFELTARAEKPWPGATEPGESSQPSQSS